MVYRGEFVLDSLPRTLFDINPFLLDGNSDPQAKVSFSDHELWELERLDIDFPMLSAKGLGPFDVVRICDHRLVEATN